MLVVRTQAELEPYRAFWRARQWHHESDEGQLLAALSARTDGAQLLAFVLLVDEEPVAMLLGQLVSAVMPWRLGYRVVRESSLTLLEALHGGLLGDLSWDRATALFDAVTEFLRAGGADAVLLRNVEVDSDVYRVFANRPGWSWRDGAPEIARNWRMTLPDSFDEWRSGLKKKARDDLRRYENKIRRLYGEGVEVCEYRDPVAVDAALAAVESVAQNTYQRGLGAGFQPTAEARARWSAGAAAGSLRVWVLRLDGRFAAFCSGFLLRDTVWLEHVGFDSEFGAARPGGYLLQRVIEQLCGDSTARYLDFGIGEADYKQRLCDLQCEQAQVYVFAPAWRGRMLAAARRLMDRAGACLRYCVARCGATDWLKRRWRQRIARRQRRG
ncbi:MAG: GNAT family N-acetyltransferase [bacterium]|nr:GNAT family N-acetyltransferase [bacterium]